MRATPLAFSLAVPPRVSHLKEIFFFLKENRHSFSLKNTRKVKIPYPCLRQTSKFHLQASYLVCIYAVIFFASLPGQRRLWNAGEVIRQLKRPYRWQPDLWAHSVACKTASSRAGVLMHLRNLTAIEAKLLI